MALGDAAWLQLTPEAALFHDTAVRVYRIKP